MDLQEAMDQAVRSSNEINPEVPPMSREQEAFYRDGFEEGWLARDNLGGLTEEERQKAVAQAKLVKADMEMETISTGDLVSSYDRQMKFWRRKYAEAIGAECG